MVAMAGAARLRKRAWPRGGIVTEEDTIGRLSYRQCPRGPVGASSQRGHQRNEHGRISDTRARNLALFGHYTNNVWGIFG